MATQNMDFDIIPQLKAVIAELQDERIPAIKKGFMNTQEICAESGSGTLIRSCAAAEVGTMSCAEVFEDLAEVLGTLVTQYEKAQTALD